VPCLVSPGFEVHCVIREDATAAWNTQTSGRALANQRGAESPDCAMARTDRGASAHRTDFSARQA